MPPAIAPVPSAGEPHAVLALLERGPNQYGGPPTRTDWAFQLLRTEILIGDLAPGERLKINDLVRRYPGLSPTPAREALARLAELGLVSLTPRRGVRVAPWSEAELLDLNRNRILLEEQAARAGLANADEGWRNRLQEAFEALERSSLVCAEAPFPLGAGDLVGWEDVHRRFHLTLLGGCDFPWLLRLIDILFENSMRYRFVTLREDPASFERSLAGHRRLLEAALAGDADALVSELRSHAMLSLESPGGP